MVAIPYGVHAPELTPLTSPRDWSHHWDGQEPPLKGEACYVVMLAGVRAKAKWQPRTLDSVPPVVHFLGAMTMQWTRDLEAARRDCHAFNANQLQKVAKGGKVKLWALVGWGCCKFPATVRVMEGGAK